MLTFYSPEIETSMKLHYARLSEKDKRQYAALECQKLDFGGKMYISKLFKMSRSTLQKGLCELNDPVLYAQIPVDRQRRKGGGRKKFDHNPNLKHLLTQYIERFKAGSPTDSSVFWVSKKAKDLAFGFNQTYGESVSNRSVKYLLNALGYRYRKQSKQLATGTYEQRNLQFEIITSLILVMSLQSPVISMDCKKKEQLGTLYRDGRCYTQEPIKVYDHDYSHLSHGKVIPHGIYDLQANIGYISIGSSTESADFVVDNLLWWWTNHGIHLYPDAKNILLLCDAGGANSYRHHIFKDRLLKLSKEIGITFIVAHYPPYSSKWNPIEHRLFCHVHHAMSGIVFTSYQVVKEAIETTSTKTGLTVLVRLNLIEYEKGLKVDKRVSQNPRIKRHAKIPELNYLISP